MTFILLYIYVGNKAGLADTYAMRVYARELDASCGGREVTTRQRCVRASSDCTSVCGVTSERGHAATCRGGYVFVIRIRNDWGSVRYRGT